MCFVAESIPHFIRIFNVAAPSVRLALWRGQGKRPLFVQCRSVHFCRAQMFAVSWMAADEASFEDLFHKKIDATTDSAHP